MFTRAAVSLLVALVAVSTLKGNVHAQKVPISCSVIMYNSYDYTSDKCVNAVINARQYCGGTRINFIPTLFWWDSDADGNTPPKVEKFCTDSGGGCAEVNAGSIATFKNSMLRCFKKAIELGFTTLDVVPHLDDSRYLHWRAQLNFSPEKKYGSYTYFEAVLQPLSDAIYEVLTPKTQIYFALVGEMSGTVFRSAKDWIPVVKRMKAVVGKGKKNALANKNLHIGTSVNWDKLCGCHQLGQIDPIKFLNSFKANFRKLERQGYWVSKDVKALYDVVDFVGASYYPFNVQAMTANAFETSARLFSDELALFGVDLKALIAKGTELRFHEYGMGGGKGGHTEPETDIRFLLRYPFFGVGGSYQKQKDPFELWRPEGQQDNKRLLIRKFYRETLKWLSTGGGPTFKVSAVYLWNSGSWDITGVNPDSTNGEGSWRDPYIANMIKAYADKGIVPK